VRERWRKPAVPLSIEPIHQAFYLPDGRVLGGARIAWSEEDISRMRAGYVCVNCLEPHEHAWPERCSFCKFPIRSEQASYFAKEYGGEERLYSGVDLDEERESLHERAAKAKEEEQR
jgi:hypothetical protein